MVRNPAAPGNAARQPGTYVDPMIDSDAYSIYIQRDTLLDSLCYSIEIDDEVLGALDTSFLCPDGIAQPDVWVYAQNKKLDFRGMSNNASLCDKRPSRPPQKIWFSGMQDKV